MVDEKIDAAEAERMRDFVIALIKKNQKALEIMSAFRQHIKMRKK